MPLDREYQAPVELGPMVNVSLGQTGVIQENAAGENEVYFHTNGLPGSFYALDAETGKVKFTEVTPNSEAVWAMTVGSDKNVYFSCMSDKKLYRYVPVERRIEYLGQNPSGAWVWDLEAACDGKIYGGTYAPDNTGGKVFEYEIASGTFRDYGTVMKGQDYVRGIGADESYIYAGLGTNIHLFKVDRINGRKSEIIVPENPFGLSTGSTGKVYDVFIVNNRIFVSINAVNMVVMDKDTHEVLHTFKFSTRISGPSPYNPDILYYEFETKLYQYDTRSNQSREVELQIPLPPAERFNDMQWIEMKSGVKKGKKVLAMVNQYGNCVFYDPADNWLSFVDLEINPAPVRIQAIKRGVDGKIYLGGYQRGMSIYNPFAGKIELTIPQFPQPEGIGCLNGRIYYGTYVGAVMYRFDPAEPAALGVNPKKVYKIEKNQDRPFAVTSGDNKLFVGTIADYGFLVGSLAVYDEVTDTWSQYNDVVENQSICSLAYKDGFLYGSTTVWGGLGIQPRASQAKLFVWDVKNSTKADEFALDIPGIDIPPKMIGDISFGPDGLLWGVVEGTIFAMDVETKKVVKSKMIYPSLYNTSKWKAHDLAWSPDGMIYTTLARKVMVIDPRTLRHKVIVDCSISDMVLGIDGSIYYAPESGTRLSRIAIPETDATLSGIYLDGMLLEGFLPGKLRYNATVSEEQVLTVTASQPGATATVTQKGSLVRPTIIQVVAPDGKSKLEYRING